MKLISALLCILGGLIHAATPQTTVSISGEDFHINGKPTYPGRVWKGHRVEGLLMNSRMVQAAYDDLNPDTAKRWAYADTGKWDAERNVSEFIAAMPEWKKHGLLAVTVNFQGGSPEGYSGAQPWITGAFNEDGSLRPDFAARMKRVLDAADASGMAVILGYFYFGQDQHLRGEAAVIRAADEATRWLLDGGWRNVLVEVNNETDVKAYDHEILRPPRVHELIERVRKTERDGRRLLVGTSYGGGAIPQENVVRVSDFLLLHGNGVKEPARITEMIEQTRRVPGYRPMPILFNEDDHENFGQPANNFAAAVAGHVSWGWFDFRRKGEAPEDGYQSPPVNWGISSARKRAFFNYLGEITGAKSIGQKSNRSEIDLSKFKLTFSDEFNGDQLDSTKWQAPEMPRQGSSRWVKSLVTVRDGALHLGIRLTQDPVLRYDCAAVRTQRDYDPSKTMFQQRYGYFEARAKFPKNLKADYWAAFWLMCGKVSNADTREGLEVDIMESFPFGYKTRGAMAFHWNGYGEKHNTAGVELAPTPELRDGEFHRFGLYWDEQVYVAFYDGKEVGRTGLIGLGKKDGGRTPSQGPCQKPGYVKLSCEAAAWAGATNEWEKEMTQEDEFVVDYVRVYEGTLPPPAPLAVRMQIDAARPSGPLKPIWRFFGADEPNYAYMPHGSELLGELGALKKDEVFFRTHNLLTTGKGEHGLKWGSTNAYTEDAAGNAVYDWTIVDRIFDTYRANGVRLYVQIGFMPQALSVKPEPYRRLFSNVTFEEFCVGWAYPPKDYAKWEELVYQWAKHCVEKYGEQEVLHWYWQTWNEPNIAYWGGSREEFFKLHDHAIRAVRRAIPGAKVGGPDLAEGKGGDFLEAFLNHCLKGTNLASGDQGTPLDFISFHAKGKPTQVDGHVRMGMSAHLKEIDGAFGAVAKYPEFKNTPIVIGESDPDGCAACKGADRDYRSGAMYSSYAAASFPRKLDLAERHGVNLEGALTWSFEFEGQPYFAGFRALATNGIDLPVLNVFRMFARMSGERLRVQSDGAVPLDDLLKTGVREKPDVSALAARNGKRITVLAWHYHDDDVTGVDAAIVLDLTGVPEGRPRITRTLIDKTHSNSFTTWQALGSPQSPTTDQIRLMELASQLAPASDNTDVKSSSGRCEITFALARQGVTLVELEWP